MLVVATLIAISGSLLLGQATADQPSRPDRTVVVQPGDTLWEITERLAPGEDPRPAIWRIVQHNGLADAGVEPGQRLRVPVDL